ncbi:MAG TPA: hypothetical protein VGC79_03240 [Polyangiaceae bacterium]
MTEVKRASRALRTALLWTSFLLSSGHALADHPGVQREPAATAEADSAAQPSTTAGGAQATQGPEQAAALAYQQALTSYSQGDVAAALNSMRQSYQLSKRAELLYNLAQLEEELNACSDSLEDYRRYLELVPHGRYREAALAARERLEPHCPTPAPSPLAAVAVSSEPAAKPEQEAKPSAGESAATSYWTAPRLVGWSAIASGALIGAGALYFELQAVQARRDYQQSVDNEANGGPASDPSLQDRQHHNQNLAIALGVTSAALVAGGALVLLLDPGKQEPHSRSARVYAAPGLVGAYYTQAF